MKKEFEMIEEIFDDAVSLDLKRPADLDDAESFPVRDEKKNEKKFVLIDLVDGEEMEISAETPFFRENGEFAIEFEKRAFARGAVRNEWDDRGLVTWDVEEGTFSVPIELKMKFEIECLKREKRIVVKEKRPSK